MLEFQHIEYLIVLAAVPILLLLFFLLLRWKKKTSDKIGDAHLVKQLSGNFSPKKFNLKFILVVIAFICCGIALAGLVKPDGKSNVKRTGIDVVIALDVSNSMLADDIKPTRLDRAKQVIGKLIDRLENNRIGLIIFAGKAYVQMPLTSDHSAAKMYLYAVTPDDIPTQGTVISQALRTSYAAFNTKEKTFKSILLISDGEDHDEEALKTTKQLAEAGVVINTVGIGSPQGARLMDHATNQFKTDENGQVVISRLNEQILQQIATDGNGIYQLFSSTDEVVNNLDNKLAGLGQTTITDNTSATYYHYFWYFVAAAILFLLIESITTERRKSTTQVLLKTTIVTGFIFLPFAAFSQNSKIIEGNTAYDQKKYGEAALAYQQALQKENTNVIARYNLGNSIYKSDKPEDAIQYYDDVIASSAEPGIKEKAYYNKGVAYQKQNKLGDCIAAYKAALKIDPKDEEARQNLQRAIKQTPPQPKQNQNKQDKKQDQDQQPKPQPSKITKRDAEEKLKSLSEHEKNLQDKLRKVKAASPEQPKKDW